ncbi:hypothetical protein R84B8_00428 [Treponema sp. R8-4-B8]
MSVSDFINKNMNEGIESLKMKKHDEAIEKFQAAFKAAEEASPGFYKNQEILKLIEMAEQEKYFLEQASQAAINEAEAAAKVLGIKIEDIDKVIAEYAEDLKRNPNDDSVKKDIVFAYYIRGVTFTAKREYVKAIDNYSNALKYSPDFVNALRSRGQSYLDYGDFDNAVADFEKLNQLSPDCKQSLANAYMHRGIAYYEKKDYNHAILDFEKALKINPNNNTVREFLEMAKVEKAKQ